MGGRIGKMFEVPLEQIQIRTRWTATLVAPRWSTYQPTRRSTDPKTLVSTKPTWRKRTDPKGSVASRLRGRSGPAGEDSGSPDLECCRLRAMGTGRKRRQQKSKPGNNEFVSNQKVATLKKTAPGEPVARFEGGFMI